MRFLVFLALLLVSTSVAAFKTVGGVTWLDTTSGINPIFYSITIPASCTNSYYVNLSSGSGSTCSQGSPCLTLAAVAGKTGTSGGPACIYIKGNGRIIETGTMFGGPGTEIYIAPWPGETTPLVLTTDGSGNVSGAAINFSGSGVHDIIIDGGPLMLFQATASAVDCSGQQNGYVAVIASSNMTLARTRINNHTGCGPNLGVGTSCVGCQNIYIINNEIYDNPNVTGAPYGVYVGGGSSCGADDTTITNLYMYNNLYYTTAGNGIQYEPRHDGNTFYVSGSLFHNLGQGDNRQGIGIANACLGTGAISNIFLQNNVFFNMQAGCIGLSGGTNHNITSNTCWNYSTDGVTNQANHAFGTFSDGQVATFRNNIAVHNNSTAGINGCDRTSGWTMSNNFTADPNTTCGANTKTGTDAATFQSVTPSSPVFLFPKSDGQLRNNGYSSAPTPDYLLHARPIGTMEIGPIEYFVAPPTSFH